MDYETQQELMKVISYLWDEEKRDYESYKDDGIKQDPHIFVSLMVLKKYLDNLHN